MELTIALRYLRWALVAWPVLQFVSGFVLHTSPRIFVIAIVQALVLWACYKAIARGSTTGRVILTVVAGLQIATGIWVLGFSMSDHRAFTLGLIAIALRGAIISLANDKSIRKIQPPPPVAAARPPDHEHTWRPHDLLDGWIRCSTCGKVHAQAGMVALINRKEP